MPLANKSGPGSKFYRFFLILGGQQEDINKTLMLGRIFGPLELNKRARLVAVHLLSRSNRNSRTLCWYILYQLLTMGVVLVQVSIIHIAHMIVIVYVHPNICSDVRAL